MNAQQLIGKLGCAALFGAIVTNAAFAAVTDLATGPLVTSSSTSVLPNVLMMMDDSGSMNWDFVPDYPPGNAPFSTSAYGYASAQCNGMFYDPSITYTPPANADGTSYSDSSFTGAWMDGYKTSQGSLNLSTTFQVGLFNSDVPPTSGSPAYYYKYLGTQTSPAQKNFFDSNSTFYRECNTAASNNPVATLTISGSASTSVNGITVNGAQIMSGASTASTYSSSVASSVASKITLGGYSATASGSTVIITGPGTAAAYTPVVSQTGSMTISSTAFAPFVKVVVSSTSGPGGKDERTNFANWFSYYRTRVNMMKTGSGLAFKALDNHYRVGFATMNNNGGSKFLNLATFDSTQKSSFYNMLYSVSVNNSTPLLMALSRVGQLYAHKLPNNTLNGVTANDPIQYSCQQNFIILSTDGFWNNSTNYNLGGSSVGNQDGTEDRPYNDGASNVSTSTTPTTTVVRTQTVTPKTKTIPWTQTVTTTASTKGTGGCSTSRYLVTTQPQIYNEVISMTTTSVDDATTTTTTTVVTTNGVAGTPTTSAPSTTTTNISTSTATLSDTGAPGAGTIWNNSGAASTSCKSTPTPSPGQTSTSSPTAGTAATTTGNPTTTTVSTTGPTVGTTTTTTTASGGTSNTLADVAMYYYKTDLRDTSLGNCSGALGSGTDVCTNNVPASSLDKASWQHMTTFTLGLGAPGRMKFSPSYLVDTSGDFYSVKNGVAADPAHGICSWQGAGTQCNWPTPNSAGTPENIDDLWHAAVNGRGTYFSATNPSTLAIGLANALSGVSGRTGASAAATTSNPNVTSGDNFVFSSTFTTVNWDGELVRQQLNLENGSVSQTSDWTAQAQLDIKAGRTIYTLDPTAANHLKTFDWSSLNTTEQGYFSLAGISTLSQFCASGASCLSATAQADAAGDKLVKFLRGDRSNEGPLTDTTKYFRQRTHVLGDIVNSEAVYVKAPLYNYADPGYSAFVAQNQNRQGMVYVGANDGMLHAFNSDTGAEAWAYVPSFIMPSLYKLADKNYGNLHQYFVDGTPVVGDAYFNGSMHTILVGGLNAGGRGYYALDVTDPASPSVLWEFTDSNLGYTFGNPVITKLNDGTWVVLISSGYNNVSPGDGKGHLYVLNAGTGSVIRTLNTSAGDTSTPSGLSRISAWVDNSMTNNTALRVYGGDLLGNLWRFDINSGTVQLLATLKDASGKVQPITSRPELGDVAGNAVVYVGTGRYLGTTDVADVSQQSFYAIKDNLGATSYGSPRSSSGFVQQVETTTSCPAGTPAEICSSGETVRTSTNNTVNFASDNGWYIDLPDSGERDNTDPTLGLGTIAFTTNIPNSSACTTGGYSYRYFLDYRTGAPVSTAGTVVAVKLGNALGTRPVLVRLPTNSVIELTRLSDGTTVSSNVPIAGPGTNTRRVSWRELTVDQ